MKQHAIIEMDDYPVTVTKLESDSQNFREWFVQNSKWINETLSQKGVIYFQSTGIDSLEKFNDFMEGIGDGNNKSFLGGNAFRSKYTERVYNASEFEPSEKIKLHTEFSHTPQSPAKLFFNCVTPAHKGGETIVADTRKVMARLSSSLKEEFDLKEINYIRNFHSGSGLGPSWQQAFETTRREDIQDYCASRKIKCAWKSNDGLRLEHTMPAFVNHPITAQKLWFNQVEHFHPSIYGQEVFEGLMMGHNNDERELPMYVTFGDGSSIPTEFIEEIHAALEGEEVKVRWRKSGLLLIDNVLTLHGRMSFEGERRILVSMV
jgi:alpha-ketoglutarate-dependent taurine dioxygenase